MQFRPSIAGNVIVIVIIGFLIVPLPCTILFAKDHSHLNIGGVIIFCIMAVLLLTVGIRQLKDNNKLHIAVDRTGITLDDTLYNWGDIYATAILERPKSIYLTVVLKENAAYRLYRLTGFRVFDLFFPITLSKYIEHFKPTYAV